MIYAVIADPGKAEGLVPCAGGVAMVNVFALGEILILDSSGGREVVGGIHGQRKPSKWPGVAVAEHLELEAAITHSRRLTRGA